MEQMEPQHRGVEIPIADRPDVRMVAHVTEDIAPETLDALAEVGRRVVDIIDRGDAGFLGVLPPGYIGLLKIRGVDPEVEELLGDMVKAAAHGAAMMDLLGD